MSFDSGMYLLLSLMTITLADVGSRLQAIEKDRLLDKLQLNDRPPPSRIDLSRFAENRHLLADVDDRDEDDEQQEEYEDEWLIIAQNRGFEAAFSK